MCVGQLIRLVMLASSFQSVLSASAVSVKPINFKTRIKNKDSFNFIITGDWGFNSYNQSLTAYQMGVYAWLMGAEFVIALGDNFYNDGVASVQDALWDSAYHDIYTSKYLQIPWFPVLGNHDYHGNVTAQIARTAIDKGVWTMPSKYYVYNYEIPGGGKLAILYIDTAVIDPSAHDTESIYKDANWKQKKLDHLSWIENVLAEQNKTANWILVAGHYPIYSIGDSGDNQNLVKDLLPILKQSKVHAYLCGHDHNHQHILKDNMHFFVDGSGGGRGPLGPNGIRHFGISDATKYMENYFVNCGFSFVDLSLYTLKMNFVDNLGHIRYTAVLDNPMNINLIPYSVSGMSIFYKANPVLSVVVAMGLAAIPVTIVAMYALMKLREPSPPGRRDTAIDVSERSTRKDTTIDVSDRSISLSTTSSFGDKA